MSSTPPLRRWLLALVLVLAVPIVPFVAFGDVLPQRMAAWLEVDVPPATLASLVVLVLASDLLLPVPSSLVSTLAGTRLGLAGGTLATWLGLSSGGVLGFALARWWGHALARRLTPPDDLASMESLIQRRGAAVVVVTRCLPVLAEAAVLLLGAMRLPWRRFLPPLLLANLGIALAYSALGHWAGAHGQLPLAMLLSIALPLAAATMTRWRWKHAARRASHHPQTRSGRQ